MAHLQNAGEQSTTTTCSPIEQLDRMAEMMLDPANREIYILPFIKRTLRQFHLEGFCNESGVFNEAYMRANNKIIKGEKVKKIPAWFKGIVYNVIREIRDEKKEEDKAIQRLYKSYVVNEIGPHLPDYATIPNCHKLHKALKSISEDDIELIILHRVEGMSWKEIGDWLVTKGKEVENNQKVEQKLRQRGNRALNRLRAKFNSINN